MEIPPTILELTYAYPNTAYNRNLQTTYFFLILDPYSERSQQFGLLHPYLPTKKTPIIQ